MIVNKDDMIFSHENKLVISELLPYMLVVEDIIDW